MKKRSHTTERKGENFGCKKRRITQEEMEKKKKTNGRECVRVEEASQLLSEAVGPIHPPISSGLTGR